MSRKTRKLIWSAPLVAVLAVAVALALFVALSPNGAQADHVELPGPVTGLSADANGQNEIKVSWKAPTTGGTPTSYRIDVSKDSYSWMALEADWRQGTNYTHDGLSPGSTRYYRVFAKNVAGTGPVAESPNYDFAKTAVATEPHPVLSLRATKVDKNQIDFAWNMPANNGGKTVKRYCILAWPTYDTDGATANVVPGLVCAATSAISDPNAVADNTMFREDGGNIVTGRSTFTFSHKKLVAGTEWNYRAYSANDVGDSPVASNLLTVTTPAATRPGAPTDLRVVTTTNNGANLYWNWPADNGGAAISFFVVEESTDNGKTWTQVDQPVTIAAAQTNQADATSWDDPQLIISTTAEDVDYYRVRATNSTETNPEEDMSRLSLPSTGAKLDISRWIAAVPEDPDTPVMEARAAYIKGPSDPTVTVSMGAEYRKIDVSWTRAGLNTSNATTDIVSATDYATGYVIDVSTDGMTWKPLQSNTSWSRPGYNHTIGLEPGKDRYYRVFGWHEHNFGDPGAGDGKTKDATSPDPVRGLTAVGDGPTKIKLTWTKPTNNGGHDITGYRIQVADDDDNNATLDLADPETETWTDLDATPTAAEDGCPLPCLREVIGADTTTYTYTGKGEDLGAGDTRWFRVIATNKINEDDLMADELLGANPEDGTTDSADAPLAPVDLTTEEAKDSDALFYIGKGVLVLWNAPDDPEGDEVTGYTLARRTKMGTEALERVGRCLGRDRRGIPRLPPYLLHRYRRTGHGRDARVPHQGHQRLRQQRLVQPGRLPGRHQHARHDTPGSGRLYRPERRESAALRRGWRSDDQRDLGSGYGCRAAGRAPAY